MPKKKKKKDKKQKHDKAQELTQPFVLASITQLETGPSPGERSIEVLKAVTVIAELENPATPNDLHAAKVLQNVVDRVSSYLNVSSGSTAFSIVEQQLLRNELKNIEEILDSKTPRLMMNAIRILKETGSSKPNSKLQQNKAPVVEFAAA